MIETKRLTEIAIFVALAVVLEIAFTFLPAMPQGGRISLATLPLFILAYRHGIKWGMISGVIYGLINFILDGAVLYHWGSLLLDYILAFGVIGFSAIFKKVIGDNVYSFSIGIVFGNILRFIMHFISGFLIFGIYAGDENIYVYSLSYNITYVLPSLILVLVMGIFIYGPLTLILNSRDAK